MSVGAVAWWRRGVGRSLFQTSGCVPTRFPVVFWELALPMHCRSGGSSRSSDSSFNLEFHDSRYALLLACTGRPEISYYNGTSSARRDVFTPDKRPTNDMSNPRSLVTYNASSAFAQSCGVGAQGCPTTASHPGEALWSLPTRRAAALPLANRSVAPATPTPMA